MAKRRWAVTGGCGFIGSEVVRYLLERHDDLAILNIDCLTYAGHRASVRSVEKNPRYRFAEVNITDREAIRSLWNDFRPQAVLHLAAESHVDRSIEGPWAFVQTNVVGTASLLEETRIYIQTLSAEERDQFRFVTVSTDEVFGSLGPQGLFREDTPYDPSSPYSASKAAADHLTRAWHRTFGIPTLVTNCSNNYGPFQFPEKLIPLTIQKMIRGEKIPVYGTGQNVRDWLYVTDHVIGLYEVVMRGTPGATYNIGGYNERTNIGVVQTLCDTMDRLHPRTTGQSYRDLISFVADRPGHDLRYAIDASKIRRELGWQPKTSFDEGIAKTLNWYLANSAWSQEVLQGRYDGRRLGQG